MKLSKNLSLKEVTKSNTASRHNINNQPNQKQLISLISLAQEVFQPTRNYFNRPIFVSSGFRSKELNDKISNSSSTSQHCKAEAFDLDCDVFGGITNGELFDFIRAKIDFDQLIWEHGNTENPEWVHVSRKAKGNNRNQILKAQNIGGKTIYTSYE
jgi:zinc D-Ala-D-Ala carboxypeptidase